MIARVLHRAVLLLALPAVILSALQRRTRGRLPVRVRIRQIFRWFFRVARAI